MMIASMTKKTINMIICAMMLLSCGRGGKDDKPGERQGAKRINSPTFLNCPKGSSLNYENFGEAFLLTHCTSCHSSALAADNRVGAPVRVNLDRLEDVARWRSIIRAVASDPRTARMPPKTKISNEERKALREWLDCGAPSENESLVAPSG